MPERPVHRRGSMRLIMAVSAALMLSTGLGGCSKSAEGPAKDAPIRIALPSIPAGIGNPYQGITLPATLPLQAVFDTMTTLDEQGNAVASLATEWTQDSDLAWTFKLRQGVSFSNGEPFNADAIVESVKHLSSKVGRGETIGSNLRQIEAAEKVDDLTVRIRLNEPDPLLPIHVAIWRIPAPKQWATLKTPADVSNAVGTGPFVITQRGDGQMTLSPNPKAWNKPAASTIQLLNIPEPTARLQAFVSGAVEMAVVVSNETKATIEGANGRMVTRLTPLVDYIGFMTEGRTTPLSDVRVRRAITMAVDRDGLAKNILGGATKPASQLAAPGAFGFDPNLQPTKYDPEAARRLLAEAGHAGGLKLSMAVTSGEVSGDTLYFQQIGSDLKKVGIDVEIRGRPASRHMQDIFTGKTDANMFSWNARGTDPITDFHHRSCLRPAPTRMPHHCDPALTAMVKAAMAEKDQARRKQLYMQIAAYERDNPPGLPLWQRPEFDAVSKRIQGYAPQGDYFHIERLSRTSD